MIRSRARPRSRADMKRAINQWDSFVAGAVGVEPQFQQPVKPKRVPRLLEPPGPSEHQLQVAVIEFWRHACKGYGLPVFALYCVPNGAHLAGSFIAAAKLKAEGLRSGIPDLFLAVPRGERHGLYIEMKAGHNKASDEQKAVLAYLYVAGYRCAVHWTSEGAIKELQDYLGQPA